MRIVVIALRHWSAGRRYKSLMVNAKRLGHQVWGFTGVQHRDDELALCAFGECGIEAYHGDKLEGMMDDLNPDLVCGERYHPKHPVEMLGQDWVNEHGKIGFMLNHTPFSSCRPRPHPGTRSHLLCANEEQKQKVLGWGWPEANIHVLGVPDLDLIAEPIDGGLIRDRLGVGRDEVLVAVFSEAGYTERIPSSRYVEFAENAKAEGWRVVMNTHPMARRLQSDPDENGCWGFMNNPETAPLLKEVASLGVIVVAEYCPGTLHGVKFERCTAYEMMTCADVLLTTSTDVGMEAHLLGRRVHHFGDVEYPPGLLAARGVVDYEWEKAHDDPFSKLKAALELGPNEARATPEFVERWCHRMDGLWWKRALDLAEELIERD